MGRNICGLCGKKSDAYTSLHRFPKDNKLSLLWKQACGFLEGDKVSYVYICCNHFKPEDFCVSNTGRRRLNSRVIPSKNIPQVQDVLDICIKEESMEDSEYDILHKKIKIEFEESSLQDQGISNTCEPADLSQTFNTPEKLFHTPVILTPEVATLKQVKSELFNARFVLSKQKRKIKTLQQTKRRLVNKIVTIKRLIEDLQSNDLISEDCGNLLIALVNKY